MARHQVVVSFVVETDGHISNLKMIKGEAFLWNSLQRLFDDMPPWEPGLFHTEPVPTRVVLPMTAQW